MNRARQTKRRAGSWLALASLLLLSPSSQAGEISFQPADDDLSSRVQLSVGATRRLLSTGGLQPYELDSYGKNAFNIELTMLRPLRPLGESWDVLSLNGLSWSSNYGYFAENDGNGAAMDRWDRVVVWLTTLDFFSFRFGRERQDLRYKDPRIQTAPIGSDPDDYIREYDTRNRIFEFGFIGLPEGERVESLVEVGYYRYTQQWPLLQWEDSSDDPLQSDYSMLEVEMLVEGFYGEIRVEPIADLWPLATRLRATVGSIASLQLALEFEPVGLPRGGPPGSHDLALGARFEGHWRFWQNGFDEADRAIEMRIKPSSSQLLFTVYGVWRGAYGASR